MSLQEAYGARTQEAYQLREERDQLSRRVAELEGALRDAVATIKDYVAYEHDGDPWTEDKRAMGEMDINDFVRDGRLARAEAALKGQG